MEQGGKKGIERCASQGEEGGKRRKNSVQVGRWKKGVKTNS